MLADSQSAVRAAVVIPCFNDGATLEEAVDSAIAGEEAEVVVVDDGSTDPTTLDVLDRLERRSIRVVRQPNAGVSAARMAGVRATTAPYVLALDADDVLLPGAVTHLADVLDAHTEAAAAWGDWRTFGDVRVAFRGVDSIDPWRISYVNELPHVAMFRREALLDAGGWQGRATYEDWGLWMALAARGYAGLRVPRLTHRYRVHGPRKWRESDLGRHDEIVAEFRRRYPDLFERRRANRLRSSAPWRMKLGLPLVEALPLPARARVALSHLLSAPGAILRLAVLLRLKRIAGSRGKKP